MEGLLALKAVLQRRRGRSCFSSEMGKREGKEGGRVGTLVKREEEEEETPPAKINLGSSSSSGPSEQREGNTFASQSTPRSSSPPPSYSEVHTRGKGTAKQGGKKEMIKLQKPRAIDIPIAGHPVTSPSSVTALTAPQRGGAPAMRPVPYSSSP